MLSHVNRFGPAIAMLCAGLPLAASAQNLDVWDGLAEFTDGAEERWVLEVSSGIDGATGHILVDAGRGLNLAALEMGPPLTFSVASPNVPEGFACTLTQEGDRLSGPCNDGNGTRVVDLTLRASYRGDPRPRERPRARDVGLVVGVFPPGRLNAITDVEGVRVGHVTVDVGRNIRTGVTAIVPAQGDLYARPVPGWIHTVNGYGKLVGETQVREFGEIETPILLTCTLCVWNAARGLAWSLMEADFPRRHTINPVVGETNDSWVNDMWTDPIGREQVEAALAAASSGPVPEGSVGAGRGTGAFGWKGGIGTSSRVLPESLGGFTVGVLVQTNFGGNLTMNGAPVGQGLGSYAYREALSDTLGTSVPDSRDGGSLMMVVATDAPLFAQGLERLAERTMLGAARTGSSAHNSSGDYVIAFSSARGVRHDRDGDGPGRARVLSNAELSPLFAAVVEAAEEAIYNAMFKATPVVGRGRVYLPLPLRETLEILERYGAVGHRGRN